MRLKLNRLCGDLSYLLDDFMMSPEVFFESPLLTTCINMRKLL